MPIRSRRFILLVCAVFFSVSLFATVRLPAIIADNMVLQQKSTITLWGWANAGEQVTVTPEWDKVPVTTTADSAGKWRVQLNTIKAGGPYTILFAASNSIEIKNVLLGEVWLASGQSNMEFFMKKMGGGYTGVLDYENEIKEANYPMIRSIDVPNKVADEPQHDFVGKWKICSPQTADTFSAVAYYFAKSIFAATGYPVGIINATWGGTPVESWTRREILENDSSFSVILDRYKKLCDEYPAAFEKYKIALEKWKTDTAKNKAAAPREPVGPHYSKSPAKLYNGMVAPLLSYTIKGVIWYQGEDNAGRAVQYSRLFPAMIANWRNDFNNAAMPFYFVQISPHRGQNPEIREAQFSTVKTVSNTGMVVTTDNGDSIDIHPRNKKLVGERLSRWALKNDYGKKDVVPSGPLYKSMKVSGNKIRVRFDYGDGLIAKDGPLAEFVIAGADQNFIPAQATIDGKEIIVWSDAVAKPVAVRFAWKNVPFPNLFNAAGLPASPFRTDNWRLTTEGKN